MQCKECGKVIREESNFCTQCGAKVEITNKSKSEQKDNAKFTKKEIVYLILIIIFTVIFALYLLKRQGVI